MQIIWGTRPRPFPDFIPSGPVELFGGDRARENRLWAIGLVAVALVGLRRSSSALARRHRDARGRRRPAGRALGWASASADVRARLGARRRQRRRRRDPRREPHRRLRRRSATSGCSSSRWSSSAGWTPSPARSSAARSSACSSLHRRLRRRRARERDPVHRARGDPAGQAVRPLRPGPDRAGVRRWRRSQPASSTPPTARDLALRPHAASSTSRLALLALAVARRAAVPRLALLAERRSTRSGSPRSARSGSTSWSASPARSRSARAASWRSAPTRAALLAARIGLPFRASTSPCAVLVTAAVGALFGLPALRLKGLYLAIATLAAQQIIVWLITHWDLRHRRHRRRSSCRRPSCSAGTINADFELVLGDRGLAGVGRAGRAPTSSARGVGRAFVAIRDQDIAAEVIGVDLFRYKLLAFAIVVGVRRARRRADRALHASS